MAFVIAVCYYQPSQWIVQNCQGRPSCGCWCFPPCSSAQSWVCCGCLTSSTAQCSCLAGWYPWKRLACSCPFDPSRSSASSSSVPGQSSRSSHSHSRWSTSSWCWSAVPACSPTSRARPSSSGRPATSASCLTISAAPLCPSRPSSSLCPGTLQTSLSSCKCFASTHCSFPKSTSACFLPSGCSNCARRILRMIYDQTATNNPYLLFQEYLILSILNFNYFEY